jgi:hypothetical protein
MSRDDDKLIDPRGTYEVGPREIWRGIGWWLFLQKGIWHTARAKNSEIEQEYDDVRYVIDEETRRQVNPS